MIVWVQVPSPAVKCERSKPLRNRGFGPFLRGGGRCGHTVKRYRWKAVWEYDMMVTGREKEKEG